MVANTLAPILTTIQETFDVSPAVSSILPTASTIGSLVINFVGGFFIASFGTKNSLKLSLVFVIFGSMLFYIFTNFFVISIGTLFLGFAMGGIFMSLTSNFAHLKPEYQNYGFFHACFGIGGIIAPLTVSIFISHNFSLRYIYLFYAVAALFLLFFVSSEFDEIKYKKTNSNNTKKLMTMPIVYVSFILFFLYSGSEISYITWEGNLFHMGFHYSKETASLFLSVFWILYTATRALTDLISKKLGYLNLLIFSSISAFLSILIMTIFRIQYLFILTGILMAPFFPTLQKFMNFKIDHKDIGLYSGLIYGFDSAGILFLVPAMGFIVNYNSVLAYIIPLISFFVVFLLVLKIKKIDRNGAKNEEKN
jgi:fucose permease